MPRPRSGSGEERRLVLVAGGEGNLYSLRTCASRLRRIECAGPAPRGASPTGVRAKCSRCEYLRTFTEDLRGTFYRCPKCREGVIAVPEEGSWGEPSDEAPAVKEALREPHPSRRVTRSQAAPLPDSGDGSSADASSTAEAPALPRRRTPTDETPRGAFFGTGAEAASSPGSSATQPTTETPPPEKAAPDAASDEGPDFVAPGGPLKAVVGSPTGRRPVKVRRILVECALCGYHVAVPPELFGKTVHCPECRADMMFSESSLEPVKDEIIGRIALEHSERRALEHPVGGPIPSPEAVMRGHRRNLVIVVLLMATLLGGLAAFAWKVFASK